MARARRHPGARAARSGRRACCCGGRPDDGDGLGQSGHPLLDPLTAGAALVRHCVMAARRWRRPAAACCSPRCSCCRSARCSPSTTASIAAPSAWRRSSRCSPPCRWPGSGAARAGAAASRRTRAGGRHRPRYRRRRRAQRPRVLRPLQQRRRDPLRVPVPDRRGGARRRAAAARHGRLLLQRPLGCALRDHPLAGAGGDAGRPLARVPRARRARRAAGSERQSRCARPRSSCSATIWTSSDELRARYPDAAVSERSARQRGALPDRARRCALSAGWRRMACSRLRLRRLVVGVRPRRCVDAPGRCSHARRISVVAARGRRVLHAAACCSTRTAVTARVRPLTAG